MSFKMNDWIIFSHKVQLFYQTKEMKWQIVLILSFISWGILAQEDSDRAFQAGIVLGFNASQLDGDLFRGYSKLGLHGGLKVKYQLPSKPKIGLSTEMLFSMKGSSQDLNFSSSNNNQIKIKLNYVEIPVIVSYKEWKVDFHGGIAYSYLIGASTTVLSTGYREEDFKKSDLAVVLGATYLFNENWGATFRFNRSFTNAIKKDVNSNPLLGHLLTFRVEYLF